MLRELAKQYADLAALPLNKKREERIRRVNGLGKNLRPPVWINEIPWNEMNIEGELDLHCEGEEAQKIETFFRQTLFRWKHFQADMIVENAFYINKAYTDTGFGLAIKEKTLASDAANNIVSHQYEDVLATDEEVEKLHNPVISAQPEIDKQRIDALSETFGDILPVRLRGHQVFFASWDEIAEMRNMEEMLGDLIERPEFMHKTMERYTACLLSRYEQMEAQNLLDWNIADLHCTPPYCDELPAKDFDGIHVRMKDMWFRGMAQPFVSCSPAMRDEFDLAYLAPVMARFGLSYYGCCEPLERCIGSLRKIPNLRKISISPWANVTMAAEQMGSDFVMARKPNPALLAGSSLDEDAVKKELVETIEVCRKNNTPFEYVLKDISTVNHKPENLIRWNKVIKETLDEYYGKE